MTAIATQGTGGRHARKTITLDGGANNGNLGDAVPVFTTTGLVHIERIVVHVSAGVTCSAAALTNIRLSSGVFNVTAAVSDWTGGTGFVNASFFPEGNAATECAVSNLWTSANVTVDIADNGGGADVTTGTMTIDAFYKPISDNGALAGDDIDTELVAAIWANATRTLTALGFTLGASDLAADTITASKIAADAITAAKIATGAVDADALATDAVTEIVTAMLTTAMTESYNADGAAPTLAQALFLLIAALTEFSISGTTITAKKLDGSTTAATFTLNSSTTPTSRTRAS